MLGLLASTIIGASSPLSAQRVKFDWLGMEEGLSHVIIFSVTQDREGFLWVGTQQGLNRYDGRSFRSSWTDGADISPVSYGWVRTLFVDSRGVLWVGVDGHGLFRFEGAEEEFHRIPVTSANGETLSAPAFVRDVEELGDSLIVATSEGIGFLGTPPRDRRMRLEDSAVSGSCRVDPTALWASPEGDLWVGGQSGCIEILSRTASRTLPGVGGWIRDIAGGNGDTVWVASDPTGLYALNRAGDLLAAPSELRSTGTRAEVWAALTDHLGDTWVATAGGLAQNPGRESVTWHGLGRAEEGGLPHDVVLTLFEDRRGVLWVGTWNGLARLSSLRHILRFVPPSELGNAFGGVIGITEITPGRLLVGGVGGKLAQLSRSGRLPPSALEGLEGDVGPVWSIAVGPDGDVWVVTQGTGIHRYVNGRWHSYREGGSGPGSLPDDRLTSVTVDRKGRVWATTTLQGLLVYDGQADRFVRYTGPTGEFEYLDDYLWPVVEDDLGFLWFGANGPRGGLHSLSPDRSRLNTYPTDPSVSGHAGSGQVISLELGGDTLVWFGTQGGGLGRLDRRDTTAIRWYTTRDGLPNNTVAGILEDGLGYLWVSTEGGLARFDPSMGEFVVFREESGLQSNRFFFNSAVRAQDGSLYFGGANGITVVDPTMLASRGDPPPLTLTRFSVRGAVRPEVNHHTVRSGLDLGPDENFFALEMAALDFTDVALNEYRYRLDPLDADWVENGTNPVANYTSVPPGRYTFRAQARLIGAPWSGEGLTIPLRVRPPFHQTWWFRSAVVVAVLSLISAFYAYRLRELHKRQAVELRELEARQELRLGIAGKLHDDIGANLSTMALKAEMVRSAKALDDRGRRQLQDLGRLARDTAHKVRETVWVVNTQYDTVAGLVGKMRDTADVMLEGHVKHRFSAPESLPDREIDMKLRQDLYLLYKESLQNVIKHAGATAVDIVVDYDEPFLTLEVSDDGAGSPVAVQIVGGSDISADQGEGETTASNQEPHREGSGLELMRKRAMEHEADLTMDGRPGGGTKLHLRVPVK
jgi:ligand-binding sensor domain-containing protein/signal transduction histidine kinase